MNAWTRDDLPHVQWLYDTFYDKPDSAMEAMERIAGDLVEHLNEHHPKPEQAMVSARPVSPEERGELWARIRDELRGEYPSATDYDHRKLDIAASAAAEAAIEWMDAHHPKPDPGAMSENYTPEGVDIVMRNLADARRERDAAVERAEAADREREESMSQRETQRTNARRARRARDEWQARTEESERVNESLRDVIEQQAKSTGSGLVHTHGFENYPEGGCNELTLEDGRIIGSCMLPETLRTTLDELTVRLALVQSGRDHYKTMWEGVEKADFAKRERIEELKRQIAELREPRVDASSDDPPAPAVSRADVAEALARCLNPEMWNVTFPAVVNEICDLFGIEAEQAVDPVEEKARELYEVGNPGTVGMWESIHEAFKDGYRRIARHVLGQEADQ